MGTSVALIVFSGCGGAVESTLDTPTNTAAFPDPSVTSLSPNLLFLAGQDTSFSVLGNGFANNAVVRVRGHDRTTSVVSPHETRVTIGRGDVALIDSLDVVVVNPSSGTVSNVAWLYIGYPKPQLVSVTPDTVVLTNAGIRVSMDGPVVLRGSGFSLSAILRWTELATNESRLLLVASASDSMIATQVGAGLLSNRAGRYRVAVSEPTPGGGVSQSIDIETIYAPPVVTGVEPASLQHGVDTTIVVLGSNFAPVTTATWNGDPRPTQFQFVNNRLALAITLTASDVAVPGEYMVGAVTPSPGGGASGAVRVVVH